MIRCPNCGASIGAHDDVCSYCNKPTRFEIKTNDAGEQLQSTEATLKQRGSRYGEFSDNAALSCDLRDTIMHRYNDYNQGQAMPVVQREAINMICHKLSRIVNGDPTYDDNWRDIAGYATLVVEHLNKD